MIAMIVKRASAVALVLVAISMSSCATSTASRQGHGTGMPDVMTRGTGDLGLVIERADGAIVVVENTGRTALCRVDGLGDLSHASAVISRDARYAFVFGRDGGLSKIDLLGCRIVKRVIQAGNSIGGAISQDGRVVAVSNYEPGGVKLFDTATLELLSEISARELSGTNSKTVGLVDAPGRRFVVALYDAGEIWLIDATDSRNPAVRRYHNIGQLPYDAFVTPDGRTYVAGLFGEDGMAMLDLWHADAGVKRIDAGFAQAGTGERLPVYKMPHFEGVAFAGGKVFVPAVGRHEVLVIDGATWKLRGRIPVAGQPIFTVARPDGREIWVNFALPDNGKVQVIDVDRLKVAKTLEPGPAVLHLEFTPRGEEVWMSLRDADAVVVYDTATKSELARLPMRAPSGIFFTSRAWRIGQ
jgi:protein NirF